MFNCRYFTTLDDLVGSWSLKIDGFVVGKGEFSLPEHLAPQASGALKIPSLSEACAKHDVSRLCGRSDTAIHIDFGVFLNSGASQGLQVASEQIPIGSCGPNPNASLPPYASKILRCHTAGEPRAKEDGISITISSNGFLASFAKGSIDFEYTIGNSSSSLMRGLRPNLFRAGTDNDGVKQLGDQFRDETKPLGRWLSLGLDCTTLKNVKRRVECCEL